MDHDVISFGQQSVRRVLEKLKSYLLGDFLAFLREKGQKSALLETFRAIVQDPSVLVSFLLKLLPNDKPYTAAQKKSTREFAKVFRLPLGFRVTLVNKCSALVSSWHSWTVIEGGIEECTVRDQGGGLGVQLSNQGVVLGECCTSSSSKGRGYSDIIEAYQAFSPAWGSRPLLLLVYNQNGREVESSALSVQSFLRLSLQWVKYSSSPEIAHDNGYVAKAHFVQYIQCRWCLVISTFPLQQNLPTDHSRLLLAVSQQSALCSITEEHRSHTVSLAEFLLQGWLVSAPSYCSARELRLLTLNLLLAMCGCLESWHSFSLSEDYVSEPLYLSLHHILVTFASSSPSHPPTPASNGCTSPVLLRCTLLPLIAPNCNSHPQTDVAKTRAAQIIEYLIPPELLLPPPPSLCGGATTENSSWSEGQMHTDTDVGMDKDMGRSDVMEVDTNTLSTQDAGSHAYTGMPMALSEELSSGSCNPSPASTLSSVQSSSTGSLASTATQTGSSQLASLYSIALLACTILKGHPFTAKEVSEYKKAHEYYYNERKWQQERTATGSRGRSRVHRRVDDFGPSYYTPNVEHLVQSTVLQSNLCPDSLRELLSQSTLAEIMGSPKRPESFLAESYCAALLEMIAVLKQCLRFQPSRRQEEGGNSALQLRNQVESLRRLILLQESDVEVSAQSGGASDAYCTYPSSGLRGGQFPSVPSSFKQTPGFVGMDSMATSASAPSSHYVISLATVQRHHPSALHASGGAAVIPFRSVYQQQEGPLASLYALWNYLLALWSAGGLRPAQVVQLLTYHQEQHQYPPRQVPAAEYQSLYWRLCKSCEGDVELQLMFHRAACQRSDQSTSEQNMGGKWSAYHVCGGLAPVESLAIKTLSMYVQDKGDKPISRTSSETEFNVCIESKISVHVVSESKSDIDMEPSFMSTHCSKGIHFNDAVCCVNPSIMSSPSSKSPSGEPKAIWLRLDSERNDISVTDVSSNSLLLSVGEVLEIRRGDNAARRSYNGASEASLFVDKLVWCTSVAGRDVIPTERSISPVIVSQHMVLLLRGRWLHDDEYNLYSHNYNSNSNLDNDSDIDTIVFDINDNQNQQQDYGLDSESEFSESNTTPAPLYFPHFLLLVNVVTEDATSDVHAPIVPRVEIEDVHMLLNLNHDQTPLSITPQRIQAPTESLATNCDKSANSFHAGTLIMTGSGGLLCAINLSPSGSTVVSSAVSVTHFNSDKFLHAMSSEHNAPTPSSWASIPCWREDQVEKGGGITCPHSADAVVTAVSYFPFSSEARVSSSFRPEDARMSSCDSCEGGGGLLLSGDSEGRVCLWRVSHPPGAGHCRASLLTDSPLQLDGSVDQLHFLPSTNASALTCVAITEKRCCLLSSNFSSLNSWQFACGGHCPPLTRATLFVKSVLDTGHCYSDSHAATYGHSLCPRYLVAYQSEVDTLLLWRVMRNAERVSEIVLSKRTVRLTHEPLPSFIPESVSSQSRDIEDNGPREHAQKLRDVTQQMCEYILADEWTAACQLFQCHKNAVFTSIEALAWQTILSERVPLLSPLPKATVFKGKRVQAESDGVSIFSLDRHDFIAVHLRRIQELLISARAADASSSHVSDFHDLQRADRLRLMWEDHDISSSKEAAAAVAAEERNQLFTPKGFKTHHMSKLCQSHVGGGPAATGGEVRSSNSASSDSESQTKLSQRLPLSPATSSAPRAYWNESNRDQPIFRLVLAATHRACSNEVGGEGSQGASTGVNLDLVAYVDHFCRCRTMGEEQRVKVYDRQSRCFVCTIFGHDIVVKLLPLLCSLETECVEGFEDLMEDSDSDSSSAMDEDRSTDENMAATVFVNISAMTFTSTGRHLVMVVNLTPMSASTCPNSVTRSLDAPATGIVVWCCVTQRLVGSLLHDRILVDDVLPPSHSAGRGHETNQSQFPLEGDPSLCEEGNGDDVISTPPRPKVVTSSRPFGSSGVSVSALYPLQYCHQAVEIDCLVLTHQDTLLSVSSGSDPSSSWLYAVTWPISAGSSGEERTQDRGLDRETCVDGCSGESRYLLSSADYFAQFLPSDPLLCVEIPIHAPVSAPPGRRMAALLLSTAQAWVAADPKHSSKVFALQGAQGSGKTAHLLQLMAALKQSFNTEQANIITCSLPTPATIITALNALGQSKGMNLFTQPASCASRASYASVAYDLLRSIAHQLMRVLGDGYTIAVLRGLVTELSIFMNKHVKSSDSSTVKQCYKSSSDPGATSCRFSRKAHSRHFSEAGLDEMQSCAGECEGNTSPEFLIFSDLVCSTCVGIFLSPPESLQLQQPAGIALVPHCELLPFLPLSRLFQILISNPLREMDLSSGDGPPNTVIVIDNLDQYDQVHLRNQVQAVVDMLLHCTPSWMRLLVVTNTPFTSTTRPYLSTSGAISVMHFRVSGDGAGVAAADTSDSNLQFFDQQQSVADMLRTLLPNSGSSSATPAVLEQHENTLEELQGVVLPLVDGSHQCLSLLQTLLGMSVNLPVLSPVCKTSLLQALSIFDFNAAVMEGLWAQTPVHERALVQKILEVMAASFEPPPLKALEDMLTAYASDNAQVLGKLLSLSAFVCLSSAADENAVESSLSCNPATAASGQKHKYLRQHLSAAPPSLNPFDVNALRGHSLITALFLTHSSNKSIAVDHIWQAYLKTYGPSHLHRSSRLLHSFTKSIRKIDETSGLKGPLPVQLGFIAGLQEIYARRVGIYGSLPASLGCLDQLRVLSMGNNKISGCIPGTLGNLGHLQRIVLHQNKLSGEVPKVLARLGCIVNLAGNPLLVHGDDVPLSEKQALLQMFRSTGGRNWLSNMGWDEGTLPVSQWYKVGVLGSNVHSIVMSSNNMVGQLPDSISNLQMLRMVELATMPGLRGPLPSRLCNLVNLRRLCICRCGLTGPIPEEISQLAQLEELQLFGNNLSGAIPSSLGDLVNLRLLSLGEYTGGNNFTSAPLPSCLSRLRKIEALFMANCHVAGPLPNWMGNLTELRQLDLQRNSLIGSIPSGFQHLRALLYLNLKDNHSLNGQLPIFPLGKLTKLNRLSLVHCGFEASPQRVAQLQSRLPRCRIWI